MAFTIPTFTAYGAAGRVTGSKHLIVTPLGTKLLLDCGLIQGEGPEGQELNRHFGFDPRDIDKVILSHAHIDHTGLLPRLVREGFSGDILCNLPTRDLCDLMLRDSAHIQTADLRFVNKRRATKKLAAIDPLYDENDVLKTMELFSTIPDETWIEIDDCTRLFMVPNAHILGSSCLHFEFTMGNGDKTTLTYTGDIGRPNDQILEGPFPFPASDYIICESTYGDRLHAPAKDAKAELLHLIQRICVDKKGKIIIPAFSIDRTQEIVYLLDQLAHENLLPSVKVYVDSPLSTKATQIMALHRESYNPQILEYIKRDGDPFAFPNLRYIATVEESKALNESQEPCIIISASGMAEAGRVKHHIANNIQDARNAILLVGYATPYSLAGRLMAGEEEVRIFGDFFKVNAEIHKLDNFSAHADRQEMIDFLKCQKPADVKRLFLVHGDSSSIQSFKAHLLNEGFNDVLPAKHGVSYSLI